MFTKFNLHPVFVSVLLLAALVLMGCGSGRASEQSFEEALDQSARVSAYAADQVPAESKLDYQYAMQNGLAATAALAPAAAGDLVSAASKLDYRYAVQNGGVAAQSSASGEYTLDFWYARQNGYAPAGE